MSTFAEHTLPNGLRVVCEVMPRVSSAALGFFVQTGSRHEQQPEHGVSHFLEHMCFKGTHKRDWREINVRFDELGSIYNAFTSKEHTVYYGWVPAARMSPQLELLADMMRPSLPAGDFDMERNVILEEIAMSADNFDHHVWNFLHQVAFGDHPLAHEVLGEKETIAGMPRDLMADYLARRYAPGNLTLLAAGAIEPEAVFAAAARWCEQWPRQSRNGHPTQAAPPPLPGGSHALRLTQFQQQAVIELFPSVPQAHSTSESIEAFVALFGGQNSRCYWNVVQKGVCTHAGAAWLSYADCGILALYAIGEPKRADEMREALRAQAAAVAADGFTVSEVQRVLNRRRTQLALEGESPRTRLMQLVDDIELYGYPRPPAARLAAVEQVTRRTIADYLRQYPITSGGTLITCGAG